MIKLIHMPTEEHRINSKRGNPNNTLHRLLSGPSQESSTHWGSISQRSTGAPRQMGAQIEDSEGTCPMAASAWVSRCDNNMGNILLHKTSYGIFRGETKVRERGGSRWSREELVWDNKGIMHVNNGWFECVAVPCTWWAWFVVSSH